MAGRKPDRASRPARRICLEFDRLEMLQLLSAVSPLHRSLGAFIAPSLLQPRVFQPAQVVDPHVAINTYMSAILGPEIQPIQQVVETQNTSQRSTLIDQVLGDPFVQATLSDQDTYTLLNSSAMSTLIGFNQVPSGFVTYVVPESDVLLIAGQPNATVLVPANGSVPGFTVVVPTTSIRPLSSGLVAVEIPLSEIPANAPPPTNVSQLTGTFADVFAATGPLIFSALQTGLPLPSPNAPVTVPGLRLARLLAVDRNFPFKGTPLFLRMFRIAIERGVFTLGPTQLAQVQTALQQFDSVAYTLNQQGTFTPVVPPAAPPLPKGRLGGTLEISTGALRNLVNVAAGENGLPLPDIGNVPGRIDIGYAFAHNGDYGLVLTLRGPLSESPPYPPIDNVGSTIQIESSNAHNLTDLNGLRTVEGLSIGTALMGTISTSLTDSGVSTFAASAGYGAGLEYGTGVAYTQVIPLGNVYALIPQSPPQPRLNPQNRHLVLVKAQSKS
jgi:hypothetical protein